MSPMISEIDFDTINCESLGQFAPQPPLTSGACNFTRMLSKTLVCNSVKFALHTNIGHYFISFHDTSNYTSYRNHSILIL